MSWSHEYNGPVEQIVESVCAGVASGLGSVPGDDSAYHVEVAVRIS